MTTEEEIKRSEKLVRDAYYKASVIDQLVNVRNAEDEQNFLKLGRRIYIPKKWYTREDIYYDVALEQLGRNIAFSEKKFIIEQILKNERIKRISLPEINLTVLKEQIQRMADETNTYPEILLAPVDYVVKFHDWYRSIKDHSFHMETFDKIIISGHTYKVFWSNKYIPFNEFIFANKRYGEWIAKPSANDRFYVKISESDREDKLDLMMYTTFRFSMLESKMITILQQTNKKQ
jgi:hypothetical protein